MTMAIVMELEALECNNTAILSLFDVSEFCKQVAMWIDV